MFDPYKIFIVACIAALFLILLVGCWMYEAENRRLKRQLKFTKTCLKDTWQINRELRAENTALKFEMVYHEITNHYPPEN